MTEPSAESLSLAERLWWTLGSEGGDARVRTIADAARKIDALTEQRVAAAIQEERERSRLAPLHLIGHRQTRGLAVNEPDFSLPGSEHDNTQAPVAPPGPTAGDVERAREYIDDWFGFGQWPPVHKLDHLLVGFSRQERASAREELLAQIREPSEELAEPVVKADFLAWSVYGGYAPQTREREWHRMRRIELDAFIRRLRALADKLTEAE